MTGRSGVTLLCALLAVADAHAATLAAVATIDEGGFVTSLDGVGEVAISPDGRTLCFAAYGDDAVTTFGRDPSTGALAFLRVDADGVSGVDGLDGALRPGFDPSGTHLYVPGSLEGELAVLAPAKGFSQSAFVEVQRDGFAGVTGMVTPSVALVSADGRHVYVGAAAGRIVVFARNAATGTLDWASTRIESGTAGTFRALALSPDGRQLYAGTSQSEVFVFARDAASGALAATTEITDGVGDTEGLAPVHEVLTSRDGRHVYVAGEGESVVAFARDAASGALSFLQHEPGGGDRLAIAPDGRRLFGARAASRFGETRYELNLLSRDPTTGLLTPRAADGTYFGSIAFPYEHGGHVISPDGAHLYGTWRDLDRIGIAAVGPFDLADQQQEGAAGVEGLDGARGVAVSPDGRHVYAAGRLQDSIAVFERSPATQALAYRGRARNGEASVVGLDNPVSVAVSPDGRNVYAANEQDLSIVALSRDAATGLLGFVDREKEGVGGVAGLSAPTSVAVSPDGKHVYASSGGASTGSVAVFSRDASSGALAFVQFQQDGVGGVDGIAGAFALAVSPDGRNVDVTGFLDDSIATFSRDATTGALSFLGRIAEGVLTPGLDRAWAIAESPDGRHVYVSSDLDTIALFSREPSTGLLTYQLMIDQGASPGPDPQGLHGIAVTRDGRFVVASAAASDQLVVFRRDRVTGALAFAQSETALFGVPALDGADAVATTPDGRGVVVVASVSDALVAFAPEPDAAALGGVMVAALTALARRRVRR